MAGGVACGPSQAELASQAKAAAEAREKAKAEAHPNMVLIPAGMVKLGETHKTSYVLAFFMDRTEVTTAAYAACVASGKCTPAGTGDSCNAGVAGRDNHPINCVDWNQADAYCKARGLRLPTEEEWEYAARGTDGREYPWGNDTPSDQLCWNPWGPVKPNTTCTCPVGSYPEGRSPFWIHDMSGNVAELTSSRYGATDRVYRGGWAVAGPSSVRSAVRAGIDPALWNEGLGFRCAGSVSAVP